MEAITATPLQSLFYLIAIILTLLLNISIIGIIAASILGKNRSPAIFLICLFSMLASIFFLLSAMPTAEATMYAALSVASGVIYLFSAKGEELCAESKK